MSETLDNLNNLNNQLDLDDDEIRENSVEKLKLLKKEIESLQENEHLEILKIINKSSIKYSENKNGIFVNMNRLPDNIIEEIQSFLKFCKSNKMELHNDIIKRDILAESFKNYN